MDDSTSTLTLEGFTPYAQIPRWVLRSGKRLSVGARALYGVIMTYASNDTRTAFPTRETLAGDLGCGVRSISTYTKELEEYGALRVERRRNKRTGNFYANHYTLVFTEPGAAECTRRVAESDTRTRPTTSTTPTSPIADSVPEPQRSSLRSPSLSERRTDRDLLELVRDIARAQTDDDYEAASNTFIEEFENRHGEELGYWDYGWSEKLDSHVRRYGIDYGTAKWLGIFTNTAQAA